MDLVIIGGTALATGVLSSVAGLGGGLILLVVLAQFLAPTVAIPVQGGIQFVSNGSRLLLLKDHVSWSAAGWASILLFPASMVGVAVATSMPEDATRLVLGVFVLIVAWRPQLLKWRGGKPLPEKALLGVGALSGFLNTTVGASGPVTSPFFKAVTTSHMAFVATAAASQVLAHTAKLIAYMLDGFDLAEHGDTIAVGAVGVIIGTFIGTRLLGRIDEPLLNRIFKTVLTLLALRLIVRGLL